MKIKEYKVFKTAAKTAKENGFIMADSLVSCNKTKRLFDFSLLDSTNLTPAEKEALIDSAIKYSSAGSTFSSYGKSGNFDSFSGTIDFKLCRVYAKDGRRLYNILSLCEVNRIYGTRKNVWEEMAYTSECYKDTCYTPDELEIE